MPNIHLNPLAYDIVSMKIAGGDDQLVPHAVLRCAMCPNSRAVPWAGNKRRSPKDVQRAFNRLGWECDPDKAAKSRCPTCIGKRHENRRPPPLPPEPTVMALAMPAAIVPKPSSPPILQLVPASSPPQEPTAMNANLKLATTVEMVRDLTVDERLKVRGLLDTHFDDAAGCYLNDYSDQRIGKELNVPWASVAKLRDLAYAPLKSNPALDEMTKALGIAETKLKSLDAIVVDSRKAAEAAKKTADAAMATVVNTESLMQGVREQVDAIKRSLAEARAKLGIGQ